MVDNISFLFFYEIQNIVLYTEGISFLHNEKEAESYSIEHVFNLDLSNKQQGVNCEVVIISNFNAYQYERM